MPSLYSYTLHPSTTILTTSGWVTARGITRGVKHCGYSYATNTVGWFTVNDSVTLPNAEYYEHEDSGLLLTSTQKIPTVEATRGGVKKTTLRVDSLTIEDTVWRQPRSYLLDKHAHYPTVNHAHNADIVYTILAHYGEKTHSTITTRLAHEVTNAPPLVTTMLIETLVELGWEYEENNGGITVYSPRAFHPLNLRAPEKFVGYDVDPLTARSLLSIITPPNSGEYSQEPEGEYSRGEAQWVTALSVIASTTPPELSMGDAGVHITYPSHSVADTPTIFTHYGDDTAICFRSAAPALFVNNGDTTRSLTILGAGG